MNHSSEHVLVAELHGPDLSYWVARANMRGSAQERNVLFDQYSGCGTADPRLEECMREFVRNKLGTVLPPRNFWH